jgi:hypothetical protein
MCGAHGRVSYVQSLVSLSHATHQINHQINDQIHVILALREREDTAAMRFSTNYAIGVRTALELATFCFCGYSFSIPSSKLGTIVQMPLGQAAAQKPQPMHRSSSTRNS